MQTNLLISPRGLPQKSCIYRQEKYLSFFVPLQDSKLILPQFVTGKTPAMQRRVLFGGLEHEDEERADDGDGEFGKTE